MAEKLSDAELESIIAQQIELAKSHDSAERAHSRDKALDYYFGNMDKYVPPETNRSKVVSRDVADTINTTLPQVTRVFLSSDRIAVVEPAGEQDRQFADQATIGLNYVFLKDNDGDGLIYDATWDALVHANAVVKTYFDDTPVFATSFHTDLSDDQMGQLLAPDEDGEAPEVLAHSEHPETVPDPATGQPVQATYHDVKIKRKKSEGSFVVDVIPPEEFLIDADAVTTAEAAFTDHWQKKTRSALVQMGYAKDEVWAIPEAARVMTAESSARDPGANSNESTDKSMQLVDYHECYIRVDVDGDGEAELVRACYGGTGGTGIGRGKLLDWEVWEDEHPFDDIKCKPVPHRWLAGSQTDDAVEVQDVKTVLRRQFLNNVYWANNPQRLVRGKVSNPEELVNPTFGGAIMGDANTVVENLEVPMVAEVALQGIQHMDETLQRRTGIVAQGEAIDPDELNNQTAAAVHDMKDARYSQVEQYARNMARGWKLVFRKLLRLMIKHQDYARKVMFNGKEVVIDPRYWNADMHVTVNVGLGTGSRDRDLQMLGQVLQSQLMLADRFTGAGAMADAIDMLPKIIETMTKMAESAGIRNPEEFYPDYTEEKVAQLKQMAEQAAQKPNPKLEEIQATGQVQQQLKQVDVAANAQIEQGRQATQQQLNALESERQVRQEQAQLAADLQTKEADRQNAIALANVSANLEMQKQERELAWKSWDAEQNRALEREKMAHTASMADANNAARAEMAKNKPNGAAAQ